MKAAIITFLSIFILSCSSGRVVESQKNDNTMANYTDTATFASGCFWCGEAVFEDLIGVHSVVAGYTGGHLPNPTYEQVCTGETGHAEAIQIVFDPDSITYEDLLEIFWNTHDPTSLNRQGADLGTQYRSGIFYHNESQKNIADKSKQALERSGILEKAVVTEIVPLSVFYPAENYHQGYFKRHPDQAYCQSAIRPKLEKFRKLYSSKLRAGS